MDIERLNKALEAADLAFWEVIARHYPEAVGGDLDPGALQTHDKARACVVLAWLDYNPPPACPECGDRAVIVEASPDWHMPRDARCDSCGWTGDDTDLGD